MPASRCRAGPGAESGSRPGRSRNGLTFRRLRAVTRQDEIVGRRPTASKTSDAAGRGRVRVPSVTLSNPAGAGSDDSQGSIGLAVPGPPIRSLVAEDRSAGGVRDQKDRTPMLTSLLTGRVATPRDERIQDGTMVRRPPGLEAFVDAQRAPASTPRGQFRVPVRVRWSDRNQASRTPIRAYIARILALPMKG
jgi:hypothetical protein